MLLNRRSTGIGLSLVMCMLVKLTAFAQPLTSDMNLANELTVVQSSVEEQVYSAPAISIEKNDVQIVRQEITIEEEFAPADKVSLDVQGLTQEVTENYSAGVIVFDNNSTVCDDAAVLTTVDDLNAIAESTIETSTEVEKVFSGLYVVPINTAPDVHTGEIKTGVTLSVNVDTVAALINADIPSPDWDTRKKIKDISILNEILVRQWGMSPTKAAAVIGNICYEDSFGALTGSAAHMSDIQNAVSRLGRGTRGLGCVQWTAAFRQNELEKYYTMINSDLSWELTSVIAETAYLYNELYVSGIIGDLSEDGDLEDLTGRIGCQYEAYGKSGSQWSVSNGQYKTSGCPRYTYAQYVYQLICGGV